MLEVTLTWLLEAQEALSKQSVAADNVVAIKEQFQEHEVFYVLPDSVLFNKCGFCWHFLYILYTRCVSRSMRQMVVIQCLFSASGYFKHSARFSTFVSQCCSSIPLLVWRQCFSCSVCSAALSEWSGRRLNCLTSDHTWRGACLWMGRDGINFSHFSNDDDCVCLACLR